jgi:hypothetical protein
MPTPHRERSVCAQKLLLSLLIRTIEDDISPDSVLVKGYRSGLSQGYFQVRSVRRRETLK